MQTSRFRPWITAMLVLYWLTIFAGTHVPRVPEPLVENFGDKKLHYCAYFGLAFLLAARSAWGTGLTGRKMLLTLLIASIYGIFDEVSQTPAGRTADILDWRADVVGAFSGTVVFAVLFWIACRILPSVFAPQATSCESAPTIRLAEGTEPESAK